MTYEAIVIGASAGGLNALQTILARLPAHFRVPVLIVQHRRATPDDLLAFTLDQSCQLRVKEADEAEAVKPGFVYLAPANYHLLVEPDKTLSLSIDARVCYARPAIDVLFETAADTYRSGLIGLLLTGANEDGTAGLRRIKERGGLTIAQDPATAYARVMPMTAIQANVIDKIATLPALSSILIRLSEKGTYHE